MTQFSTGRGSAIRDQPRQLPRLGEAVSLGAPGVVGAGPNFADARVAGQVADVIDRSAGVFGGVVSLRTQEAQIAARDMAELNAASQESRDTLLQLSRAQADQRVAVALPEIDADVRSGRRARQAGESVPDFARRIATETLPQGVDPTFADRWVERLSPHIASAEVTRAEAQRDTQNAEVFAALTANVAAEPTAENIAAFRLRSARGFATTAQVNDALTKIMASTASAGNRGAFGPLEADLGEVAPLAVAQARRVLDQQTAINRNQAINDAMPGLLLTTDPAEFDSLANQIMSMEGADPKDALAIAQARGAIQEARGRELVRGIASGQIGMDAGLEQARAGLGLPETDTRHIPLRFVAGIMQEAEQRADREALDSWHTAVIDQAAQAVPSGSLIDLSEPVSVTLPSGRVETMSVAEVKSAAMERVFADLDATITDPAANLTAKVDALGQNNAVAPQFQAILQGGYSRSLASLANPDAAPDPRAVAALTLAIQMDTQNPAVFDAHTSDDEALFYRTAATALRYTDEGNPSAALARVARLGAQRLPITQVRPEVAKAMTWTAGASNAADLSVAAEQVAALYVAAGAPPKDAAQRVSREFRQRFTRNGAQWLDARSLPEEFRGPTGRSVAGLQAVTTAAAARYVSEHPDAGLEASDLSLRQSRGLWVLWDTASDTALPGGSLTTDQLTGMARQMGEAQTATRAADLSTRQDARDEVRSRIGPERDALRAEERDIQTRQNAAIAAGDWATYSMLQQRAAEVAARLHGQFGLIGGLDRQFNRLPENPAIGEAVRRENQRSIMAPGTPPTTILPDYQGLPGVKP